jgi:hypothetical protein
VTGVPAAGGRRKIQYQGSYTIHTAAALAEDWIWSAADIEGAVRAQIRWTEVYALLDGHNLDSDAGQARLAGSGGDFEPDRMGLRFRFPLWFLY